MKERLGHAIFSTSGASLMVGVTGFLSAIVTMFVATSVQVSVKWLLAAVWIFLTLVIILLKLVFDLSNEKRPPPPYEIPIQYIQDEQILIIRRNENFANQVVVGCYSNVDGVERLMFLGAVLHVQDNVIQIKVWPKATSSENQPIKMPGLSSIIVRPVIPTSAFQTLASAEMNL